ncbi:MAG TPA: PEP-CTERM sorting domain-containing protein [Phycisphaerae bacterium]|nr:PEP-CTERM sorting domain-containing protein [Phycisphaerales bacterium]HNO78085.1 PEP-CTERM sorting domain-containing protein [Phycisphaerae bacterium]
MRKAQLGIMALAAGFAIAPSAMAAIDLQITEIWTGLSGEDGTADWIEVTNFGDTVADTGNYWFDDSGPSTASGGNLDSFLLGQGESAIFLLDTAPADNVNYATAADEFVAIWGSVANLGQTNGGGNLGQGGDSANLLLGDETVVDTLPYASSGDFPTFEKVGGPVQLSVVGVNGAYESAQFFNDNIGPGPDFLVTMIGSPGVVPEPASILLLCSGAVCIMMRRRQS